MTRIKLGEVFPAAAGAFLFGKDETPEILHVLGLARSSWLPQALFFWCLGMVPLIAGQNSAQFVYTNVSGASICNRIWSPAFLLLEI